MQKYFYLPEMIDLIEEPNRSVCKRILKENEKLFRTVPGSTHNHQNWPGGYWDHIQEVMNIAIFEYDKMDSLRPQNFSLSSALLVLFLYDLEKLWKYEVGSDGELRHKKEINTPETEHWFRDKKLYEYGIVLTPEQKNAMLYVHEEMGAYSSRRRMMGPLAAFCCVCDIISAIIWFEYPRDGFEDSWWPAQRVSPKQV